MQRHVTDDADILWSCNGKLQWKVFTFVHERKVVYNTKKEYHNRNMMHNFRREVYSLYMKYQTGEPLTILFRDQE